MTEEKQKPPPGLKERIRPILATTLGAVSAAIIGSWFGRKGTLAGLALGSAISSVGSTVYDQWLFRTHQAARHKLERLRAAHLPADTDTFSFLFRPEPEPPFRGIPWKTISITAAVAVALAGAGIGIAEVISGRGAGEIIQTNNPPARHPTPAVEPATYAPAPAPTRTRRRKSSPSPLSSSISSSSVPVSSSASSGPSSTVTASPSPTLTPSVSAHPVRLFPDAGASCSPRDGCRG